MVAAFAATLGRPAWWSMALAAFLVRGGIVLVLLPVITLPTPASLATALSPTVSALAFGGLNGQVVLATSAILVVALGVLGAIGLAGAWLDRAQLLEAATDEDLDVPWVPAHASLRQALALRLAAHLPTLFAVAYATFALIGAAYDELLAPGDAAIPLVFRIVARAPETLVLVPAAWLIGEAVGAMAGRRAAAGGSFRDALLPAARQVLRLRGLSTLLATTTAVLAVLAPFLFVAARSWEHLRELLLGNAHPALIGAALLVLVATWILGLASTGVALAWRTAAWTAELAPAAAPVRKPAALPVETAAKA